MSIFLFFLSGIIFFYIFRFLPFTTCVLFAVSAVMIFLKKPLAAQGFFRGSVKEKIFLVLLMIAGFAYASFRYSPPPDPSLSGREMILDCVVNSSPSELSPDRFVNEARIRSAYDSNSGRHLSSLQGKKMSIVSDQGLGAGLRYLITAKTGSDTERLNPGMMKSEKLYGFLSEVKEVRSAGTNRVYLWFQERRARLNQLIRRRFESDSAALLVAVTTGERSAMSEEVKDAFNTTGLAHLLSISGTHFGLFSTFVFGVFRFTIRRLNHRFLRRFTLYLTPSQGAALLSLPFIGMYLLISGLAVPTIRSFIMISIFLFGLLIGRKGFWLNSLLFAAFLICIWDPSAILSISFHLSFLAVLFIGVALGDRVGARKPERSEATDGETDIFRRISHC